MDRAEARRVATEFLAPYRAKGYAELVALIGTIQTHQVVAPSGVRYQLELQAFWDDPKKPNDLLRVTVAVDDRTLRAFMPVSEAFLVGPNASFVDAHVASNNRWRGP
jgi:hypothetical protein